MLVVENLTKSFDGKKVLQDITFQLKETESLVFLGQSGVGKSVLLQCLIGLIYPDSGSISYANEDITFLETKKKIQKYKGLGVLFQNGALFDSYNVWENIAFYNLVHNIGEKNELKKKASKILKGLGFENNAENLMPSELSGGMRKRVALARAIFMNPPMIFFDEPTSGLDPINSNIISNLIRKSLSDIKAASITITHDINSAITIADKIAILAKGKIVWEGTVSDFKKSNDAFVKSYLGKVYKN